LPPPPPADVEIVLRPQRSFGLARVAHVMFTRYRSRSALCVMLMMSQAFLYNAIFFTYALVLTRFYDVPAGKTGLYLLPFAIGNFLGPVALGHWFDTIGRRPMIALTYGTSATLLALTGWLFTQDLLSAAGQTAMWSVIFFFASAAASWAVVTYNMNILQGITAPETFCVTLNNSEAINPVKILGRFSYDHPVFSVAGIAAQQRWQEINGQRNTWYCGAYWHNGFHEDGVVSALRVANALNQQKRAAA